MGKYRLTHVAQADIAAILAWSRERFGAEASQRYETLIATAIRDAAQRGDEVARRLRPELGDGVFSWHLAQSSTRSPGETVAMELQRHLDPRQTWELPTNGGPRSGRLPLGRPPRAIARAGIRDRLRQRALRRSGARPGHCPPILRSCFLQSYA